MSNKEAKEQKKAVQEAVEQQHNITEVSGREAIEGLSRTPEPIVTGNENVRILKHSLNRGRDGVRGGSTSGAEIAVRNVSDTTIASIIFEAVFYDIEGNVLDIVKHREIELKPKMSRAVLIRCPEHTKRALESYDVKIARMALADVEKVQLRHHEVRTIDTGEEEVRGIVKNISNERTDTALIAAFFNSKKENIGTKVIILRDIEPDNTRQFHFLFKPQKGDMVSTYTLNIGEVVE